MFKVQNTLQNFPQSTSNTCYFSPFHPRKSPFLLVVGCCSNLRQLLLIVDVTNNTFSVLVVEHDKCVLFSPEPIVVNCTTKTDTDPHRIDFDTDCLQRVWEVVFRCLPLLQFQNSALNLPDFGIQTPIRRELYPAPLCQPKPKKKCISDLLEWIIWIAEGRSNSK